MLHARAHAVGTHHVDSFRRSDAQHPLLFACLIAAGHGLVVVALLLVDGAVEVVIEVLFLLLDLVLHRLALLQLLRRLRDIARALLDRGVARRVVRAAATLQIERAFTRRVLLPRHLQRLL